MGAHTKAKPTQQFFHSTWLTGGQCQERFFPDLLLIRRVSKWVRKDGRGYGGEEGFVD